MEDEFEPRPLLRIPSRVLPRPASEGCVLGLILRDDREVVVGVDSTGMVYGVLVPDSADARRNPIDFIADEIVSVRQLPIEVPPGFKVV